jgi:hypothetical protein
MLDAILADADILARSAGFTAPAGGTSASLPKHEGETA